MAEQPKYGIITASKKQFHPGEPIFILRATDDLAAIAIEDYAHRCQQGPTPSPPEHVAQVLEHAKRIRKWQSEHPELVKVPD